MPKYFVLLASLASLPLTSQAQTAPELPHFYVGVSATMLSNLPFNNVGVPTLVGPGLTAGWQFTPKWAVQVGAALMWQNQSYGYSTTTNEYHTRFLTVPLLLRYSFTPAAERFHFDGLVGVTLLHGSNRTTYTYLNPYTGGLSSENYNDANTNGCLTLGPSVRYSLSPRVELMANAQVNATLGNAYSFADRLFLNTQLGVHYTFGQH